VISRDDIRATYDTIRPYIRRTPVVQVDLGELDPAAAGLPVVTLKLEQLQCAGSFKARGAFANLLLRDVPPAGVMAASGGNHGVAVAYAASRVGLGGKQSGVPARIFVPTVSAPAKIERIRQLGADLVVTGERYADALAAAQAWVASSGAMSVHAFDQRETLLGQGTLALELAEQAGRLDGGDLDTVLVPVGGGGMISGIATAIKLSRPSVKVIGVEPELAADAQASLRSGQIVPFAAEQVTRTMADGLRTQSVGPINFEHIRKYVDDIVTVRESEIREAMRRLAANSKTIAEPSGAVAVAAFLFHRDQLPKTTLNVAVISGGNIEPKMLEEIQRQATATA